MVITPFEICLHRSPNLSSSNKNCQWCNLLYSLHTLLRPSLLSKRFHA